VTDAVDSFKAFLATSTNAGGSAIDLLLAALDPGTVRLLQLAAIPHEFNAEVLTVLDPSLDLPNAEQAATELAELSIVSQAGDSLTIHETARRRLFTDWLAAQSQDFAAANGRLVDYYVRLMPTAAPARWAIERTVMFHLFAVDRAAGLAEFERLLSEGRRSLRFAACDTLLALVHEYDQVLTPVEESRIGFTAGKLAYDRGEFAEAVNRFITAFAKRPTNDVPLTVRILNRLGMAHDALRAWPEALEAFGKARELAHDAGLWQQETRVTINTALALQHQGDIVRAQSMLESIVRDHVADRSPLAAAAVYATLGSVQRRNNDIDAALASYARAQQLLQQLGDNSSAARVVHDIAAIYTQLGDRQKSREAYRRSLALNAGHDPLVEGRTLLNLAIDCKADGALDEAADATRAAYARFESAGVRRDMARSLRVLALVCSSQKKPNEAQAALSESVALFRAVGDETTATDVQSEFAAVNKSLDLPWWGWCSLVVMLTVMLFVFAAVGWFFLIFRRN